MAAVTHGGRECGTAWGWVRIPFSENDPSWLPYYIPFPWVTYTIASSCLLSYLFWANSGPLSATAFSMLVLPTSIKLILHALQSHNKHSSNTGHQMSWAACHVLQKSFCLSWDTCSRFIYWPTHIGYTAHIFAKCIVKVGHDVLRTVCAWYLINICNGRAKWKSSCSGSGGVQWKWSEEFNGNGVPMKLTLVDLD